MLPQDFDRNINRKMRLRCLPWLHAKRRGAEIRHPGVGVHHTDDAVAVLAQLVHMQDHKAAGGEHRIPGEGLR